MNKIKALFNAFVNSVDWAEVSPGTWARYAAGIVVSINMILTACDMNPLPFSDDRVYVVVSSILEIFVLFMNTYKNNSTSKEAIAADGYMKLLKQGMDVMIKFQDDTEALDNGTYVRPECEDDSY